MLPMVTQVYHLLIYVGLNNDACTLKCFSEFIPLLLTACAKNWHLGWLSSLAFSGWTLVFIS